MKKNGFGGDDNITLLAKGVQLKGEIRVEGTVRIDGRLDGDIHTKGQVIVGEDGLVQGTIAAGIVVSSGRANRFDRRSDQPVYVHLRQQPVPDEDQPAQRIGYDHHAADARQRWAIDTHWALYDRALWPG